MDLISLLNNTSNGLSALQSKAATISNNMSNASTPGYARQQANLVESNPSVLGGGRGFVGGGVHLGSITQDRDQFIEAQLPKAFSNSSGSTARSDALSSVSVFDNGVEGDLTDALSSFYSNLTSLAQNAGDSSLRQSAVQSATWLASSFNRTANAIELARSGVDASVESSVHEINQSAQQVADLNNRISTIEAAGGQPTDLLDKRQNLIDKMAQLVGTNAVPDAYGNVSLVLPGGVTLVNGRSATTLTTQGNSENNGHVDIVFTPGDGSSTVVLKNAEIGGQIGGQLTARDTDLGQAMQDLNTLAYEFAGAINAQNRAGYDLNGNAGGDIFVVGSTSEDVAASIAVNSDLSDDPSLLAAASSPDTAPGDSSNLQLIAGTQDTHLSNGINVQQGLAKIVSDFGVASSDAENAASFDKSMLQSYENSRESVSGVSLDNEMIDLMQVQHAFEALSKVITVGDSMLETLMKIR
jgi:flagellar hook-associated protein 1